MPIETFRASSMREALALVRERLGADAVVLGSREIAHRRFPWSRPTVETEVTAAVRMEARVEAPAEQALVLDERLRTSQFPESPAPEPSATPFVPAPPAPSAAPWNQNAAPPLTDALFRMFTWLIDADMDEEHARNLLFETRRRSACPDDAEDAALKSALLATVESQLCCSGGIALETGRRRVVALAGPTGVGKTTTIAKLAANLHLTEQRPIGLITLDTFRVGAIDQLRTYAEVIGLPMKSASNAQELVACLDEFHDKELVLIDTAGRSPRDEPRIHELRDLLSDAAIDEIHLVLSLSASHRSRMSTFDRFRVLRPTHLLLTKLDEAAGLGAIHSAARSIDLPLSYFTTGQDVPDDIEPAAPGRTARLIVGLDGLERGRDRSWRGLSDLRPPAADLR